MSAPSSSAASSSGSSSLRSGGRVMLAVVFIAGLGAGWAGHSLAHRDGGDAGAGDAAGNAAAGQSPRRGAGDRSAPGGGAGKDGGSDAAARPLPAADSKQFAQEVRNIFRMTDEDRRVAAFDKVLERSDSAHLAALVDLIRENDLNGNGSAGEWSHLWARWGETDAMGAFQFVAGKDWNGWDNTAPQEARRKTIAAWVERDPAGALNYFEQSGDIEKGNRDLVYPLVRGLCNSDPDAAMQWLMKSGLARGDEYKAVIDSQRRMKGMEGADAWFDQLAASADSPQRDLANLAQTLLSSRQTHDPEQAMAWVEAHLDAPWMNESGVLANTAGYYGQRNPQAAMEWADKLHSPAAQQMIWNDWLARDSGNAMTWMEARTGTDLYATMAPSMAQQLAAKEPDKARAIAGNIPDEAMRDNLLQYVDRVQENMRVRQEAIRQSQQQQR